MRNVVISDMREYLKKHKNLIVLSMVAAILCFGFLAFSGNIRIDTEELINEPGSMLGWLTIGRYSLALFKQILGLTTFHAIKSGVLFLIFFVLGSVFLTFSFYHFSKKDERYPYWVFILLYATSNIWSFQVYFSMQEAEIALAMLLVVLAAFLAMRSFFCNSGWKSVAGILISCGILVLGLGAYQALAAYYIAICVALFLLWMEHDKGSNGKMLGGILGLMGHFVVSYLLYNWIAKTWFMATEAYMQQQKGWGRMSVGDCIHSLLLTGKNIVIGYGPRNFSFYTIGVLLVITALVMAWKKKCFTSKVRTVVYLVAVAGLMFTPFLMTLYMGEMLVTRSQFALPVVAAFLGMYGMGKLSGQRIKGNWLRFGMTVLVLGTVGIQLSYNIRLAHTDNLRYKQDVALSEDVLAAVKVANGGVLPEVPLVFVGYQKPNYDPWCARTEMYGWSFYEWDYSIEEPTGATHRIQGFLQAYTKDSFYQDATDGMRSEAAELSQGMPSFPEEGAVEVTEDFVVIKLSEINERTDLNWW